jgi:hypothetical protein
LVKRIGKASASIAPTLSSHDLAWSPRVFGT